GRSLGRRLVPADRPLRLPARSGLANLLAHRLLPAVSDGPARDRVFRPAADPRRGASVPDRARARAVRDPPPDHARAFTCPADRRRSAGPRRRSPGRTGDRVCADGLLLLRGLLGVPLPGAVGRPVLVRAPGPLGGRGRARRARRRDPQCGRGAPAAGAGHLPLRAARGPLARCGGPPVVASPLPAPPGPHVAGSHPGRPGAVHRLPGAGRWRRADAVPRAGCLGQALRGSLRGHMGRPQGRARGRPSAAVAAAPSSLLPDRPRQPVRRSRAQPDAARLPDRGRRRRDGRAAYAPAGLRRLCHRRPGPAALLPGDGTAPDVAAALPGGPLPAEHVVRVLARRPPPRAAAGARRLGPPPGALRRPVRHLALGGLTAMDELGGEHSAVDTPSWYANTPAPGLEPPQGPSVRALRSPDTDWPWWTAPLALLGGLVLAAVGGLLVDIPALVFGASITASHVPAGLEIVDTVVQDVAFVLAAVFCAQMGGRTVRSWQFGLRPTALRRAVGLVVLTLLGFLLFSLVWATSLHTE